MVALEKLNRKLHWRASFLCLESIDTPLAEMRPNRIVASRDFQNKMVWPILRKPRMKQIKANIVPPLGPLPDAGEQTVLGALDDGEDDYDDHEEDSLDEGSDEEIEDDSEPEMTQLFNKVDMIQALQDLEDDHDKHKKVKVGESLPAASSTDNPMASPGKPANTQAQLTSMSSQGQPQDKVTRGPDKASRAKAAASVSIGSGSIAYYENKGVFEARCTQHASCVLTRVGCTCKPSFAKPSRGKPLGLLSAWLLSGAKFSSQAEHKQSLESLTLHGRQEGRMHLLDLPEGELLVAFERDPEEIEPLLLDGLL
eukprot:5513001-Amphidinium_carterae.1